MATATTTKAINKAAPAPTGFFAGLWTSIVETTKKVVNAVVNFFTGAKNKVVAIAKTGVAKVKAGALAVADRLGMHDWNWTAIGYYTVGTLSVAAAIMSLFVIVPIAVFGLGLLWAMMAFPQLNEFLGDWKSSGAAAEAYARTGLVFFTGMSIIVSLIVVPPLGAVLVGTTIMAALYKVTCHQAGRWEIAQRYPGEMPMFRSALTQQPKVASSN